VPVIGEGEALVRTRWISLDPANRAWLDDTPTYLPPVAIGDVMRASGVGEVVASNSPDYPVGRLVVGRTGWQDYAVASASAPMRTIAEIPGVSPSHFLGALGTTGLTAHVGMLDIARPRPGETVVVSAAAGAVGSIAGQLARMRGARVVGIAGDRRSATFSSTSWDSTRRSTTRRRTGAIGCRQQPPTGSTSTSRTSAARSWRRSSRA
jgi:NADPH-dependent curcumin reductase CurA